MDRTRSVGLVEEATARLEGIVAGMDDAGFAGPSSLPGWTRAHLVTHLANNAASLVNLLTWARTGVETPAYASPAARDADIETGAERPPEAIRSALLVEDERLRRAIAAMDEASWEATVVTAQGRSVPAETVLWLRTRELWVHLCDLGVGVEFSALPDDVLARVLEDVMANFSTRPGVPPFTLAEAGGGSRSWSPSPESDGPTVTGDLPDLVRWVTGRGSANLSGPGGGALPSIPAWI